MGHKRLKILQLMLFLQLEIFFSRLNLNKLVNRIFINLYKIKRKIKIKKQNPLFQFLLKNLKIKIMWMSITRT